MFKTTKFENKKQYHTELYFSEQKNICTQNAPKVIPPVFTLVSVELNKEHKNTI